MKFILFVEGYTEDKALPSFFKKWIDPRVSHPVGIKTVRFNGWSQLVDNARVKAVMHLNGPDKDSIIAIISLLDLYGPTFFPENLIYSQERYTWAKNCIERSVNHPKFFQFFAVHEVEAWLLSQPDIFPPKVAKALPSKILHPESINFTEPPAKLLNRLYSSNMHRTYKKVVYGKELFSKLDPNLAYQKCPNLQKLLDKMLDLAINS